MTKAPQNFRVSQDSRAPLADLHPPLAPQPLALVSSGLTGVLLLAKQQVAYLAYP